MPKDKIFKIGYGIIIFLTIILLSTKVDFIFRPLEIIFTTLFFPFLVSGIIFYLLRPIVRFLGSKSVPNTISIIIIYLLVIGLGTLLVFLIGPVIQKQFQELIKNFPQIVQTLQDNLLALRENKWFARFEQNDILTFEKMTGSVTDYFQSNVSNIGSRVSNFIGILTSIATIFVTVPFIVFYLLKDGEYAPKQVLRFLPYTKANEAKLILKDMDHALSSYIQGQALVSLVVGVMMYIGYLIIGLDYSILLAMFAMLTNVIPFLGPFIAVIPAVIVGFLDSPFMVIQVLIVVVVVQQIDGNVTSPLIMGKRLDIHPLTIILLLIVAGSMGGLLGMLLAVPTYAILKVICSHSYRLYLLRKERLDPIRNTNIDIEIE
ncbi:AI-2E family transporter [Metabacillus idriensis]|uniref:AI-2E family transporter n=1 Tax=Metabacillus idriensis TaxID=324768 RepID=UPI0028139D65|nr:AI-2E family transporter [Metabacillus idriensis]MDR0136247.1 AI-2E family transporter [Metabacillus idriensis]